MDYLKLFAVILTAILMANAIINAVEHYATKERRELEKEKLKLEIELKKRVLTDKNENYE